MTAERFVALGLAHPHSDWFNHVGRWATAAALPLEFIKCLSTEELRARLASGRRFSALIVEGRVAGVDRDLLDRARRAGCATIVVDDDRAGRDWRAMGAATVLDPAFARDELRAALEEHAPRVADALGVATKPARPDPAPWRGPLVAVLGPGGAGSTTVAMALAQGLADDPRHGGRVVLADLCLDGELALLHDARDILPGLPELIDAHRRGEPATGEISALTFELHDRGYRLLLGLRRHRDWTTLRPRAVQAAIDGLRRSFRAVVVDVDADLEGEVECGSVDVEERNLLARSALEAADAVVVVGQPGVKGTHSLLRVIDRVSRLPVTASRILTVVNRAPRGVRNRAELTRALGSLTRELPGGADLAAPVYLPERKRLDDAIHDATRLPETFASTLSSAVNGALARSTPRREVVADPEPVAAGTLGSWTEAG